MAKVSLDFGGVGSLPEEGTYRITCDKAVYKPNKAKTGFIINFQMHLTDMEDENFENFKMFDNPSLAPQALWKMKEILEAFTQKEWDVDGMEIEVDDDTGEVEFLADATALAVVYHEEYNGKPQARVKTYLPDNGLVEIGPNSSL